MGIAISVKNLTKSFGRTELFNHLELEIEAGLLHGLVGPGGSGKSVLLRMIATLLEPDQGQILLFGKNIKDMDQAQLDKVRQRIGFQFQNLALFDFLDVMNNVAFPLTKGQPDRLTQEIRDKVETVLKAVGLPGVEYQEIKSLSGGMKRRVAMARAMIGGPDLLILDDPSAGLDPVTSSRIFELVRRTFEQARNTVLLATQDVDRLIKIADRIHILYNGIVHFSGNVEEIWQSNDPVVRQFFPKTKASA